MNFPVKPQPHRRRTRQKEKPSRFPLRYPVILIAALLPGLLVYIWLHVQKVNLSYQISKAQKQKKEMLEINKKLRIELANLKAPERIERIALERLNLRPPDKKQIEILQ